MKLVKRDNIIIYSAKKTTNNNYLTTVFTVPFREPFLKIVQ